MPIQKNVLFNCQSQADNVITLLLSAIIICGTAIMNVEVPLLSFTGLELAIMNTTIATAILARVGGASYQNWFDVFIEIFTPMFIVYIFIHLSLILYKL